MDKARPRVLLVEHVSDLRELNRLILLAAGCDVEEVAPDCDPVSVAAKIQPAVIVANIRPGEESDWTLIDRLEANPQTESIPVVAISASHHVAASAQAAPVVRATVVMPYDIDALRDAVAQALKSPPPAAVLPRPARAVPRSAAFAGAVLTQQSRQIVLQAIRRLQQIEPFRSRFRELSAGLVDELPLMLGAVATGLQRGLEPAQVTAPAEIHQAIRRHVQIRISQGIGVAAVLDEYDTLEDLALETIRDHLDQASLSAADAFEIARVIDRHFEQLVRRAMEEFVAIAGEAAPSP